MGPLKTGDQGEVSIAKLGTLAHSVERTEIGPGTARDAPVSTLAHPSKGYTIAVERLELGIPFPRRNYAAESA